MTRVRTGTGLDEDLAVEVWQAAEAGAGRRNGGSRAQRVRARLRHPLALLLVAERDAGPSSSTSTSSSVPEAQAPGARVPPTAVGVLLAEVDRADGLIVGLLAVRPEVQRTGVARALLEALLDRYPSAAVRLGAEDAALHGVLAAVGLREAARPEGDGSPPPGDDGPLLLRRPEP